MGASATRSALAGFPQGARQICKRLHRRLRDLQLANLGAYRARLDTDPAEWRVLDDCCHVTISRFYRDRHVFDALRRRVLPDIAARAEREQHEARVWSAGCASGEEPYTLKILWDMEIAGGYPQVSLLVIATDADTNMLARARKACFEATSLHDLPCDLIGKAFDPTGPLFCLKPQFRKGIEFLHQDLRSEAPAVLFDIILCRYVAFTYFAPPLRQQVLGRILERLLPNGYLVIGTHEQLPGNGAALTPLAGVPAIFQKASKPR